MSAVVATMRSAFAEARANRSAFWTQIAAIILNDIVWVIFWAIFFAEVGAVRGWQRDDVLLLLAVLCSAAGLALGMLANARRVGWLAVEGELDAVLALPVPPLAHLLVRKVETVHLGDSMFGVVLFAVIGLTDPARIPIYLVGVAASVMVMVGFLVLTGSLAFFTGRGEPGDMGFHALLVLSSYPVDIFTGAAKVLLYSVVPAAFVTAMPARLIQDFDLADALTLLGAALGFCLAGWATFTLGLRRYTSGSVWTRA